IAQSFTVNEKNKATTTFNVDNVESIEMSETTLLPAGTSSTTINLKGTWCSIGTSITWYNDNVSASGGRFTRGYQDRVMDRIHFAKLINKGLNGQCLKNSYTDFNLRKTQYKADYYTIEHGINDWGHVVDANHVAVGDFEEDYINKKNKNTFAYYYRMLIDLIFSTNPYAKVVLCTPRKAYGFGTYLPAHWYDPMIDENGKEVYLEDYANLIRKIAEYESFPLCDWFAEAGGQRNLAKYSIDEALHPNDTGHQIMANLLVEAFMKTIIPPTK
ncbi:MAG: SGNH/GDSL hydrolase family protein, partial [Prevotellaceae bacterium]|nr:SGNH/GDSL hydrolase family protein [Candidatus Faecinaster equi]